ncbi:MAG: hypothetical protein WA261_15945, partial [Candidatus Sulfotelmatobacter sp.]
MSNIFDALQRAELENSGRNGPSLAVASELLQEAEQKLRASGTLIEPPPPPPTVTVTADAFDVDPAAPLEDLERCPVLSVAIR